jgi:CheY-like chemotaxis protein
VTYDANSIPNFNQLLEGQGRLSRFHSFQNLMCHRIREILVVSSLYDSFILEEDGHLHEMIVSEYHDLNLSQAPGLTRVSNGREAIEMIKEQGRFDLLITTPNVADMDAVELAGKVKECGLDIPVVLLTYENRELSEMLRRFDVSNFKKIFLWQGDSRILLSIIKYIEDILNVENDTRSVGVQSVILIEDNIHFYSSFLPLIYTELFRHSQSLISEGINISDRMLRMRARPKILLCSTYEEAWEYYQNYEDCVLGVISDIEFPRNGKQDPKAGIRFARKVRGSHADIPVLLQSDHPDFEHVAKSLDCSFLLKTSPTLLDGLRQYMVEILSFGDFVFRMPDGEEVSRAHDLRSLEKKIRHIPEESLRYHAERNHFSNWLKARTEFWLAHELRPRKVSDYESLKSLRAFLIQRIRDYRKDRQIGSISDFDPESFDTTSSFARIGGGSLGGKARGLGFANLLIETFKLRKAFTGTQISIPPAVVLGTDVFDRFLDENHLRDMAIRSTDHEEVCTRFEKATFPRDVSNMLARFLNQIRYPLAVRSSSLLEDSRYLPFAGIYATYMLPNNHERLKARLAELISTIKRVYASIYSARSKDYIRATPYRLEEEKMAIIIQKLVGSQHDDRFYPSFAGVVRSHNFYPRPPMTSSDGIATVGLGLGRTVIEGGEGIRFCPRYPRHRGQFTSIEETLDCTQKRFFVLQIDSQPADSDPDSLITSHPIDVAEKDGTLEAVGSTFSPENYTLTDGLSRQGVRLVTFGPILRQRYFPLPEILGLCMDMGSWGMSSPVEIEFAVNLSNSRDIPHEFAFLQIRPLIKLYEAEELEFDNGQTDELICQSPQVLGNGIIDDIRDLVVVDPDHFDRSRSLEAAEELGKLNSEFVESGLPYILIVVGRLGSADPWLGIPVTWNQISGARAIVESGFKGFKVVPSQGTHFFQNITSFNVGYFTVNSELDEGFIDWPWLKKQPAIREMTFTRHIRLDRPVTIKMNGHQNRGVVFKPSRK